MDRGRPGRDRRPQVAVLLHGGRSGREVHRGRPVELDRGDLDVAVAKAKAVRPLVEKMITLGKKGDLHSRRQALAFLMTDDSVTRLFDTVAPRYGDRNGGYLRIVKTGFQKGDGAEKAFIELLGAEKQLDAKRHKRDEIKAKKRAELEKHLEETKKEEGAEEAA